MSTKQNTKMVLPAVLLVASCVSAGQHRAAVADPSASLTVAAVQRDLKVGMTSTDVVTLLGAPNMVTTDENRNETWVYDKVSTDTAYSESSGSAGVGALGVIGMTGLLGGASGSAASGARSTTQKTLTIVVRFDKNSRVADYSYRQSKF